MTPGTKKVVIITSLAIATYVLLTEYNKNKKAKEILPVKNDGTPATDTLPDNLPVGNITKGENDVPVVEPSQMTPPSVTIEDVFDYQPPLVNVNIQLENDAFYAPDSGYMPPVQPGYLQPGQTAYVQPPQQTFLSPMAADQEFLVPDYTPREYNPKQLYMDEVYYSIPTVAADYVELNY